MDRRAGINRPSAYKKRRRRRRRLKLHSIKAVDRCCMIEFIIVKETWKFFGGCIYSATSTGETTTCDFNI
jgi:hypothetical protein